MERLNLKIVQGKTFRKVVRWEKEPFVYSAIASIAKTAPARIVTTAPHGLTEGWRVAVVSAGGMRQINAATNPPKEADFRRATVINATTVDLNTVNASDYTAFTSGGYLQWYTPQSLDGMTARLTVKDKVGGNVLVALTDSNGIALDDTAKTITFTFGAADSAAYAWTKGVYELEMEDADGFVTGLYFGTVSVTKEVAT